MSCTHTSHKAMLRAKYLNKQTSTIQSGSANSIIISSLVRYVCIHFEILLNKRGASVKKFLSTELMVIRHTWSN